MNKALLLSLGAALVLTTGCSVLPGAKKSSTNVMTGAQATRIESSEKAEAPSQKIVRPNVASPVLPTPAVAEKLSEEYTPDWTQLPPAARATMNSALARNLGGQWSIIQVGSTTIDSDDNMPYIIFQPSSAQFYANNGCNTLNGAYSVSPDDVISFHNVLSTMRLCPEVTYDNQINTIIADNAPCKLRMTDVANETFIDFVTSTGKTIMRIRRGNLSFLDGQWNVKTVSGLESLVAPADIFIDLTELKIHADTGCNMVNGSIYLDHRAANAIDFSELNSTRMACPPPMDKQQTAILVALEETTSAISDGADKVMLLGSDGRLLMTLSRAAQYAE